METESHVTETKKTPSVFELVLSPCMTGAGLVVCHRAFWATGHSSVHDVVVQSARNQQATKCPVQPSGSA